MKPFHALVRPIVAAGTLCFLTAVPPTGAQQPVAGTGSSISRAPDHRSSLDLPDASPEEQHKLEKIRQSDRQRRMVAETDRLLALAAELKAEMDKTAKDVAPGEVIKKATEIEKLARSVKDRMKG